MGTVLYEEGCGVDGSAFVGVLARVHAGKREVGFTNYWWWSLTRFDQDKQLNEHRKNASRL